MPDFTLGKHQHEHYSPLQIDVVRYLLTSYFTIDPKETAIVLIEFQNAFTTEEGKLHEAVKECMAAENTLANGQKLMNEAHAKGCTIVHTPILFDKVRTSE
jgi:hypothetical protein